MTFEQFVNYCGNAFIGLGWVLFVLVGLTAVLAVGGFLLHTIMQFAW